MINLSIVSELAARCRSPLGRYPTVCGRHGGEADRGGLYRIPPPRDERRSGPLQGGCRPRTGRSGYARDGHSKREQSRKKRLLAQGNLLSWLTDSPIAVRMPPSPSPLGHREVEFVYRSGERAKWDLRNE